MDNSESLVPYDGMNRIRCNGLDSQPAWYCRHPDKWAHPSKL